jgi:hypothetical protein
MNWYKLWNILGWWKEWKLFLFRHTINKHLEFLQQVMQEHGNKEEVEEYVRSELQKIEEFCDRVDSVKSVSIE